IEYSNAQNITIRSLALKPANGEIRDVVLTPGHPAEGKAAVVLKTDHIAFNINKLEFVDKKLNVDLKDLLVENVNGTFKAGEKPAGKSSEPGIIKSVIIRKTSLKNSNITYDKGKQPLTFHELNATVNNIELSPKP